ncbi:glutathione S-transferase [Salinisphaera sp. PC39]|uniref:glutathione S-transferase N-terminal domain-containing protein n=1 Tax=Salinisphaera sp. PC39 TaxID=1304156 RepID=UPI0033417057
MSLLDTLSSTLASTARGWRGTVARPAARQPAQPLELYEFEGCPFCRLVREALTELDLDALIHPCPKGGTRYRPVVESLGGKAQFPFLVDPNTGERMYESAAIVDYLYRTYGDRRAPRRPLGGAPALVGSQMATALRGLRGMRADAARRPPEKPLELYSFESSPFSRPVRETLCELEIPYLLRSFGKASGPDMGPPWVRRKFFPDAPVEGRNRKRMREQTGRLQVPYLVDPNTGDALYESQAIVDYLRKTYGH